MTASGKFLAADPVRGLAAWKALPAAERAPGAITIPADDTVDAKRLQPTPPPGGLIVRLFYRHLVRGADGDLRRAGQDDFPHGNRRVNLDAQPNYLWLTQAEWRSLLPARPKVGDHQRVPDVIADRICLQYLHPVLAFCACSGWSKDQRRGQELKLIVEDVAAGRVRLRFEGFADLGAASVSARAKDLKGPFGYQPRLSGVLEYDPRAQRITRFELVALGDTYGYPNTDDAAWRPSWRAGRQPLGVAFEMVRGDTPGERIPARIVP